MASLLPFSLPKPNIIKCSSSTTTLPITETLDQKFGRKGIKFTDSGTVELSVRNGSSLSLQIPNGLITSYKPKVYWKDDGFEEILFSVGKDKGGIGLVVSEISDVNQVGVGVKGSKFLSISDASLEWVVKDVDSDSIDAVQVELSSKKGTLEITYVISLYSESIATAVVVKNNGRKAVTLKSAILSHLKFKNRSKTAIQGLKGCSYLPYPPLSSPFEIVSPGEAMKTESSGWFGSEPEIKPGIWSVQTEPFILLNSKISRVYTAPPTERVKRFYNTAPSKYETIDQGRELAFRVIRMGYEDIHVSSPGSLSEKYGNGYFICTGPASLLVPVVVNPGEEWRGAQVIEHDNLT